MCIFRVHIHIWICLYNYNQILYPWICTPGAWICIFVQGFLLCCRNPSAEQRFNTFQVSLAHHKFTSTSPHLVTLALPPCRKLLAVTHPRSNFKSNYTMEAFHEKNNKQSSPRVTFHQSTCETCPRFSLQNWLMENLQQNQAQMESSSSCRNAMVQACSKR